MPITFQCGCGQSMTVADQFAGKMGRCPKCKNPVQVPMPGQGAPPPSFPAPPQAQPRPAARPPGPGPGPLPLPPGPMAPPSPPGYPPGVGAPQRPTGARPSAPPPSGPPTNRAMPRPMAPPAPGAAPAAPVSGRPARLVVVNGPDAVRGRTYVVQPGKVTVIGRDSQVDLAIPSDRISRRHCQLEPTADGVFVLADLGSSNGTLVNQERIAGRKVLFGGEYIQVGDVLLQFAEG